MQYPACEIHHEDCIFERARLHGPESFCIFGSCIVHHSTDLLTTLWGSPQYGADTLELHIWNGGGGIGFLILTHILPSGAQVVRVFKNFERRRHGSSQLTFIPTHRMQLLMPTLQLPHHIQEQPLPPPVVMGNR